MLELWCCHVKLFQWKRVAPRREQTSQGESNVHLSHIQTQEQDTGCPRLENWGWSSLCTASNQRKGG